MNVLLRVPGYPLRLMQAGDRRKDDRGFLMWSAGLLTYIAAAAMALAFILPDNYTPPVPARATAVASMYENAMADMGRPGAWVSTSYTELYLQSAGYVPMLLGADVPGQRSAWSGLKLPSFVGASDVLIGQDGERFPTPSTAALALYLCPVAGPAVCYRHL
jgi:hypothetical protein